MEDSPSLSIRRVLVVGDNMLATSIIARLQVSGLTLHQIVPQHFTPPDRSEVAYHKSDFSTSSLRDMFTDLRPDLVINSSARGGLEAQRAIIDSAIEAGVRRYIPAEFENDSQNTRLQERLPPLREKAKLIEYLSTRTTHAPFQWIGIATGLLLDRGLMSGKLGFDLQWHSVTMHGSGNEPFAASSTAWIGEVVAAVVKHWADVTNQYLYAAGMVTSANEVLRSFEQASGTWDVGRGDVDECIREAERRIERGFPDASMFLMERTVLYDGALNAAEPFKKGDAKTLLGLGEGEKVPDVVKRVLHEHKHQGKGGCGCD